MDFTDATGSGSSVFDEENNEVTDYEEFEGDGFAGLRFCEPSQMTAKQKRKDIDRKSMQLCVQGTFKCEDADDPGFIDTRWQSIDDLVASLPRENFQAATDAFVKDITKSLKREAKALQDAQAEAQGGGRARRRGALIRINSVGERILR